MRFESFHRAWEPRLELLIGDAAFLTSRRRLGYARSDLAALGGVIDAGAVPNLSWLWDAGAAWGSIYVMEGSTLGGQIISKAVSGASWLPSAGLRYFNPYGRRTAEVWRETTEAIEGHARLSGEAGVIAGAVSTFETLTAWLTPVPEPAQ